MSVGADIAVDIVCPTGYPVGMSKNSRTTDLAAELRAVFADSGLSRFELARRSDVSYSVVHRFIAGERDITLGTASRLCDVLGVELRTVQVKKKRK